MKTAEEWFDLQSPYLAAQRRKFGVEYHQAAIDLIKQIQLDAWKQGMTDASQICWDCHFNAWTNINSVKIKIENERDSK